MTGCKMTAKVNNNDDRSILTGDGDVSPEPSDMYIARDRGRDNNSVVSSGHQVKSTVTWGPAAPADIGQSSRGTPGTGGNCQRRRENVYILLFPICM